MNRVKLIRWKDDGLCTLGVIQAVDFSCHTIERPWKFSATCLGGKPFESCIPDGTYDLTPFTRPSGQRAYMLSNEDLDVFKFKEDIPEGRIGRYLILIHTGNYVEDIVGCIAPGLTQTSRGDSTAMVGSSRVATSELFSSIVKNELTSIDIRTLSKL